jgi:hypothetical protein
VRLFFASFQIHTIKITLSQEKSSYYSLICNFMRDRGFVLIESIFTPK